MKTRIWWLALTVALLAALPATAAQYRWKGGWITDPYNFQAARNWTPLRSTPLATDTLLFRTGVSNTVTHVPTQTVRELFIDSSTQVVMSPDSSRDSLRIGTVFQINYGSSLTISSVTDTMWLYLPAGAGASINGTLTLHTDSANSGHRFEAADKNAIAIGNGGTLIQECGGSVFGSTGQDSTVNFNPLGTFINRGWGNPFGYAAGANRSKIHWHPGSRYVHQSASVPSLSGRRYADFEADPGISASIGDTASGTAPFVCDSLIFTSGEFHFYGMFGVTINGDLRVENDALLQSYPAAPFNWSFTGSANQYIKGSGTINFQPKTKLVVNKPTGGLYLSRYFYVSDTTHLTKGLIYTGSNTFYNNMSRPMIYYGDSSYIVGNYQMNVPLGNTYLTAPVGTANGSSPLVLWTYDVTTPGKTMTISAHQGVHPNAPVPSQSLQRYWHIESNLVPGVDFTNYEAVFYYRSADFNTGFIEASDEATMALGNYNGGAWTSPLIAYHNTGGPGGNIDVLGLVTYSDFTMAKSPASFDTTKPRITGTFPTNNETNVALDRGVSFCFSKPISTASFAYAVTPVCSGLLESWNSAFDTVRIVHNGDDFKGSTTYTAKITAAYDQVGNPLAVLPDSIMFTTVANQHPQINVVQTPQDTYDGSGPFVVKAVITDPGKSVASATMYYAGSHDNSISNVPGVALPADTMRFTIGEAFVSGTVVEYYVMAHDDQGDSTRSPAEPLHYHHLRILSPSAPTTLTVTTGDNVDSLCWTAPAESLYYAASSNGAIAVPLGDKLSTRFTPQHDYYKLERAVSLWQLQGVYDTVRVHVYHDNGAGLPDTSAELVPPFKLKVNNYPAATVADLGQYGVYISTGDFHIAYESLVQNKPFIRVLTTGTALPRSLWDSSGTWKTIGSAARYAFSQAAVVSYSSYGKKGAKEVGHYEVYRDAGSGYSWLANDYDLFYADNAVTNGSTYGYQVRAVYPRNSLPDTFSAFTSPASIVTAVSGAPDLATHRYFLGAVRPNPMRGSGVISFGLTAAGRVSIEIYNIAGQRVKTLVDGDLAAGPHTVTWNGRNEAGQQAAAGLYFYRMQAGGFGATQKLLLVK